MEQSALEIVLWVGGIAFAVITGLMGLVLALAFRLWDRNRDENRDRDKSRERTGDRIGDKQGAQAELLAGYGARITQLEDDRGKIADALDRLARLEEFRIHASDKLEEAEATARSAIAFGEQMKTVFKRLDALTEQVTQLPRAVAAELRTMIRPAPGRGV